MSEIETEQVRRQSITDWELWPPSPITGWEDPNDSPSRWPICKQRRALEGPLPGRRADTLLMLACEAAESGETDEARILAFLLAVPQPNEPILHAEHVADCLAAAVEALQLKRTGDATRLSGCTHIPDHSGHPAGEAHRAACGSLCGDTDAANSCPILLAYKRGNNRATHQHILDSSIWRDNSGKFGLGLGEKAKAIYKAALDRSHHNPTEEFQFTTRYAALKAKTVRYNNVGPILKRLVEHGLVLAVEGKESNYTVPFRSPAWVNSLADELGTRAAEERERAKIFADWGAQRKRAAELKKKRP